MDSERLARFGDTTTEFVYFYDKNGKRIKIVDGKAVSAGHAGHEEGKSTERGKDND